MNDRKHVAFWLLALLAFVALLALLRDILMPFVTGAVLAYFLNPVADRLERHGLGRGAAATVIVGLSGIVILAAILFLAPLAIGQMSELAKSLPSDLDRARLALEAWAASRFGESFPTLRSGIEQAFGELTRGSSGMIASTVQFVAQRGMAFFNLVSLILVTPIVVFYLLCDWRSMLSSLDNWLPREHQTTIRIIANDIDEAVSAFVRGQGTICIILGILYAIALSLVGLNFGLVIGLATGVLAFVPIVGWSLGLAVAMLAAVSQSWPDLALPMKVAGIYVGVMALDSAVLSPNIVGQRIGLHPVWMIFALFVFSVLFGLVGTLVAVPVAAALGVLVRFALARYLESPVYLGETAHESKEPPTGGKAGA